jgi:hypothetical protein
MKFVHIGWCKEGIHDKVWGIILIDEGNSGPLRLNKYLSFWGRRGAKLQTKVFEDYAWGASNMFSKKERKGYQRISECYLDEVYPEFKQDLEKTAMWAMLKL